MKTAVNPLKSRMAKVAGRTNYADTSKTPIVGIITAMAIPTNMPNKSESILTFTPLVSAVF